jgi:hypothetical protein
VVSAPLPFFLEIFDADVGCFVVSQAANLLCNKVEVCLKGILIDHSSGIKCGRDRGIASTNQTT